MEKEIPEMRKEAQTANSDTGNLAESIKWVYRRYGTDLSKFFQDAYRDAARRQQEQQVDNNVELHSA